MTYLRTVTPFVRWLPVWAWTVLLVQGCALTAPSTAWRPAEIDVEGIRRISVLPFSGDNGQAVAASLTSRLWENDFYALVDQSELRPVRMAAAVEPSRPPDPADYLDSARRQRVDGIIVGDVIEYRCDDHLLTNTEIHLAGGRESHPQLGSSREGMDAGVSQEQIVHREATVGIVFRLVEVETGRVRATRRTVHNFQGELSAHSARLPTKGEVLDELTQRCVDEFIAMLAPHEVELQMPLARSHLFQRGQALVGKGNDFARRGRWEEAMAAWQQAVEVNPSNDAALYNLALGHSSRREYRQAEGLAIQAINLKHRDLYAEGLEQIRQFATDYEKTLDQRQQAQALTAGRRPRQLTSQLR